MGWGRRCVVGRYIYTVTTVRRKVGRATGPLVLLPHTDWDGIEVSGLTSFRIDGTVSPTMFIGSDFSEAYTLRVPCGVPHRVSDPCV